MIHTCSTTKRDVFKATTAGITGLAAFGTLTATGALAGMAAGENAAKHQNTVPTPSPVVEAQPRPHRTDVYTRIVHTTSTGSVAAPAAGGVIRSNRTSTSSPAGNTSTRTVVPAAPVPVAPKPAAVAPKPVAVAPAPTSGS